MIAMQSSSYFTIHFFYYLCAFWSSRQQLSGNSVYKQFNNASFFSWKFIILPAIHAIWNYVTWMRKQWNSANIF